MKSILKALAEGNVLVSDGAWGTFLHKRGLKAGECPELWNLTHRNDVFAIAKSYIDAGADIILTNSFGGSSFKLKHYELDDKVREINKAAAAISREAAGDDHFVMGSIGPTGVMLMMGEVSAQELSDGFKVQAESLAEGGVDSICIETMSDVDEAKIAVAAAKEATGLEIVCTFTFERTARGDYRTMMGISPADMVLAMKDSGASVVGTNCGNGIKQMIDIVKEMRTVDSSIPLLVHANAGRPVYKNGETVFPETPEVMALNVKELISCGANIVGGCCGTTPAHIAALVNEIRVK